MVVDSRTVAKHTTARQLNPFVDRYRMFTVLKATGNLDAATRPLRGSQPERIWLILASKGHPDPIPINRACYRRVSFEPLAVLFASAHPPWDRTGSGRRAYRRWLRPRPGE